MPDDPEPTAADKRWWAAILASVESPLHFFALFVLVVDAFIALAAFAVPEAQRIYVIGGALAVLVLVVLVVAVITFYRPKNLHVLQEVLDGQAIRDVVVDVLAETLPDRLIKEYDIRVRQEDDTADAPEHDQPEHSDNA